MSADDEPTRPDKRDLLSAFDQVVDREKEKARAVVAAPESKRTKLTLIVLCLVSWGGLAYTWLAKPAWLFPPDPALLQTPAQREATLRFGMYLESERVRDHFQRHRRLPMQLEEAGDVEAGVEYAITGDSTFVLTGKSDSTALRLSSADDAQEFLRPAGIRISKRGQ